MTSEINNAFSKDQLAQFTELSVDEYAARLQELQNKKAFIIDMDGVIYRGSILIPGVKSFISWLQDNNKQFLFLTNNSAPTPKELSQKLGRLGLPGLTESHFYTSGIATAKFLKSQKPNGGKCYVIGEAGLTYALYEAGFTMSEVDPDFVVVGEGSAPNFEKITKAVNLVLHGARLIGTNPDVNGPSESGVLPACGAFMSAIELASGRKAFYCGKPSSLMMRFAQSILGSHKAETCIIGDRMDTDILAGTNAQIDPVLVLSGVTAPAELPIHAYRPWLILNCVENIVAKKKEVEQKS